MVSVPTTALVGFSDIVQHSAPDSPAPNLSTPHAPAPDAEATESRLCGVHGCSVLTWERPVEDAAIGIRVLQYSNDTVVGEPSSEMPVLSNYRLAESMTSR